MYDQDIDECCKTIMELKRSYKKEPQDQKEKKAEDKFL